MEEQTPTQPQETKQNGFLSRFAIPGAILFAVLVLASVQILSTQILVAKLDQVENRLPKGEGTEKIPVKPATNSPTLGNAKAAITIVEFADFQCPFCKDFDEKIFPRLKEKYIDTGKVKFVFNQFPILGDESVYASEASVCAQDQGKFWDYFDLLYKKQNGENQGTYKTENLKLWSTEAGLEPNAFNACVDSRKYQNYVYDATMIGIDYGVSSTPTIFINGRMLEGSLPWYRYEQVIDEELAAVKK